MAALLPARWDLRLRDLHVAPLDDADLAWADVVLVSGMLIQLESMRGVLRRARAMGKRTVVGGPAPSTAPELFDGADHVFRGEAEGRLDLLVRVLEAPTPEAPRLLSPVGDERPDLALARVPRFDLVDVSSYASLALQYSRGCPFQCEFCDIIEIFGRVPRVKAPEQVVAELDALRALGARGTLFFVDDNFVANRREVARLLPVLRAWQERNGFPFVFCTEASIDLATHPDLVRAMVEAGFGQVFVGIETPSTEALAQAKKTQNLRMPQERAVEELTRAGLEVYAGSSRLRRRPPRHLRPAARVHLRPAHRAGHAEPPDGAPRHAALATARAGGPAPRRAVRRLLRASELRARDGRAHPARRVPPPARGVYSPTASTAAARSTSTRCGSGAGPRAQRRQRFAPGALARGLAPRHPRPAPEALLAARREGAAPGPDLLPRATFAIVGESPIRYTRRWCSPGSTPCSRSSTRRPPATARGTAIPRAGPRPPPAFLPRRPSRPAVGGPAPDTCRRTRLDQAEGGLLSARGSA